MNLLARIVTGIPAVITLLIVSACSDGNHPGSPGHDHHGTPGHDHHGHDHSGPNAHLWMDPVLTKQFIEAVAEPVGQVIEASKGRRPLIVASIHPVASLIQDLVGDAAEVRTILPQGGSPHGFEVTPDVVRLLGRADLVVTVGLSMDPWAEKATRNLGSKDVKLVKFAELVEAHQEDRVKPLPEGHALKPRVAALGAKLDALHAKCNAELAEVKVKNLVTFHNAFDLLATRYDLKVVAHLTEMDLPTGAEVTPQHLREVKDAVTKHKLKVLYAEPTYPDTALRAIQESTGVAILRLDDLGGPDREGYRTYFEMMESNLKTLVDGQNRE